MLHEILHLLTHALLHTLQTLPFLFAAYLLIEYLEHRAGDKLKNMLSRFGRFSPAAGAVTGIVPQCGFSVTAAKLYAGRIISFGTLAAVFISTSDEAIPILLTHPELYGYLWKLILIKIGIAAVAGFAIDAVFRRAKATPADDHSDAHDELHAGCAHGECEHGILRPALKHTLLSGLFIFLIILAMEVIVALIGEEAIAALFAKSLMLQPLLAALLGFVPNCASSIILTELFCNGALTFGSLVAGLVTNAGVGYAVLFRSNKNLKQNLLLLGVIFLIALASGYIIQLF